MVGDGDEVAMDQRTRPDYPEALLLWSGHRDGGVKKPFGRETGRPAGAQIETPLLVRLKDWVKKFVSGDDVPFVILLVGGPGNGKTDAVDGLIDDLDRALTLHGKLYDAFGAAYVSANASCPPRRVDIALEVFLDSPPDHLKRTISVVQDATEADPINFPGKSAQALLLDELEKIVNAPNHNIYICCVNRGKLAEAITVAHATAAKPTTLRLLNEISMAVTSSPVATSCWPLQRFPSVVAWPMDVDSLVDASTSSTKRGVFHHILDVALQEDRWPETCPAGDCCPFCTNRKMLARDGAIDRLAELLRAYELGSGKRWTFRDLYSLVPYMLVGDEDEFVVDGKRLRPCDWAAAQIQLIDSKSNRDEAKRSRALFLLVGRLYWHRLFPQWPRLSDITYREAAKIIKPFHADLLHVQDLIRYLAWPGRNRAPEAIARLVSNSFCGLLDPADADPDDVISRATTTEYATKDIDENFSLSVGQGLKIVSRRITHLERQLIGHLAAGDDALGTDVIASRDRVKAGLLQCSVRLFSSRLVKRSLGVQNGVYANRENLNQYKMALRDPIVLRKVQHQLKSLINDQTRNLFSASLMTTFAQPAPARGRSVTLETAAVKVTPWVIEAAERPDAQLAYLKVDNEPIPLTFGLYNALQRLCRGMHSASLDEEVFAMVDRTRARVAGSVVRDMDRLLDDAVIKLAPTREEVRFTGEGFSVERPEVNT